MTQPVIRDLMHVEHAWQTVWSTPVATPTVRLSGIEKNPEMDPGVKFALLPELRGAAANFTGYVDEMSPVVTIPMQASYEHIHYPLEWIFGAASPSGTSAPYTRDYAAFLETYVTPHAGTIQFGDSVIGVYQMAGLAGQKLELSCAGRGLPLKANVTCLAYSTVAGAFKSGPALSYVTVNPIMGSHGTAYLDVWGGTMGNTALASTLISFNLTIDTGLSWYDYFGNSYNHSGVMHSGKWKVTLAASVEFNATSKAWADAWLAATWQKLIRIKFTTGSTSALKLFQADFAGTLMASPKFFSDDNGRLTMDLTMEDTYDSIFAHFLKVQTKCADATLI